MAAIPPTLGSKVSTRQTSWADLVEKAWGSEFRAPDHKIYQFGNNRNFDSTDKGLTGLYGVVGDDLIYLDNQPYPDMRDAIDLDYQPVNKNGALNNGFGTYVEVVVDNSPISSGFRAPPSVESDPYYGNVQLLIHDTIKDFSQNNFTLANGGDISAVTNAPAFLGGTGALAQLADLTSVASKGYVDTPASFAMSATTTYTLEFSMYMTAFPASSFMLFACQGTGDTPGIQITYPSIQLTGLDLPASAPASTNPVLGRWYQIALCFDGAQLVLLMDGSVVFVGSGGILAKPAAAFSLFSNIAGGPKVFRGYIKEVRYTMGIQRYGATYTPRTTPFPNQ